MLLLADRGFNGFAQWQQALASGAQLMWRATESRLLPVRVIEYQLPGVPGVPDAAPRCRLITSLLNPQAAPAVELAKLYHAHGQAAKLVLRLASAWSDKDGV